MNDEERGATVRTAAAPVFGTNCYVVGGDESGGDCVVIDAGVGVAGAVRRLIAGAGLTPRAVLATHGHVDHTWDAAELCDEYGVPFVLHAADAYRIADPFGTIEHTGAGVSGALGYALGAAGAVPGSYREPEAVEAVDVGEARVLRFGSVELTAVHAPGHTQGSTLYLVGTPGPGAALTGDVLFAGTIGRTDLPGGDGATMARTLADVVGRLDDRWRVLPGHGPETTMAREKRTNPFLANL